MATQTELFDQMKEIQEQIQEVEEQYHEKMQEVEDLKKQIEEKEQEAQDLWDIERAEKCKELEELAAELSRTSPSGNSHENNSTRSRETSKTAIRTTEKKPRGRPPGSKNKSTKVSPDERNYGQDTTLKKEILRVISMTMKSRNTFKSLISDWDYPKDAKGLKINEMRKIIDAEKRWVSSSDDISSQIQNHVYKLKEEGKLDVNEEDRRYFIPDGVTLD